MGKDGNHRVPPDERTDVMEETLEKERERGGGEVKERMFWENKFPPKTLRFSAGMFRHHNHYRNSD